MKKLNPEKKCLLILSIFNFSILLIFIPISAVFNLWGLTLGWVIGTVITFLSMAMLFKSGHIIINTSKESEKKTGIAVAFYLLRFLLLAGLMVLCAVLDYTLKINAFKFSLFTCAGSALPSTIIITIFYKSDDQIEEKKQ